MPDGDRQTHVAIKSVFGRSTTVAVEGEGATVGALRDRLDRADDHFRGCKLFLRGEELPDGRLLRALRLGPGEAIAAFPSKRSKKRRVGSERSERSKKRDLQGLDACSRRQSLGDVAVGGDDAEGAWARALNEPAASAAGPDEWAGAHEGGGRREGRGASGSASPDGAGLGPRSGAVGDAAGPGHPPGGAGGWNGASCVGAASPPRRPREAPAAEGGPGFWAAAARPDGLDEEQLLTVEDDRGDAAPQAASRASSPPPPRLTALPPGRPASGDDSGLPSAERTPRPASSAASGRTRRLKNAIWRFAGDAKRTRAEKRRGGPATGSGAGALPPRSSGGEAAPCAVAPAAPAAPLSATSPPLDLPPALSRLMSLAPLLLRAAAFLSRLGAPPRLSALVPVVRSAAQDVGGVVGRDLAGATVADVCALVEAAPSVLQLCAVAAPRDEPEALAGGDGEGDGGTWVELEVRDPGTPLGKREIPLSFLVWAGSKSGGAKAGAEDGKAGERGGESEDLLARSRKPRATPAAGRTSRELRQLWGVYRGLRRVAERDDGSEAAARPAGGSAGATAMPLASLRLDGAGGRADRPTSWRAGAPFPSASQPVEVSGYAAPLPLPAARLLPLTPPRWVERLRRHPRYEGQILHSETLPGRRAQTVPKEALRGLLRPSLLRALPARLFSHQAEAVRALLGGSPVVVSTPTASGKSLCFLAPAIEWLLRDPEATCVFVYPTKALAHDQIGKIRALCEAVARAQHEEEVGEATGGARHGEGGDGEEASAWSGDREVPPPPRSVASVAARTLTCFPFDGDQSFAERDCARLRARILVTNPDALHASLLPGHAAWARFLAGLSLVALDEAHVYRGAFGAQCSMVVRRLLRLAAARGAAPSLAATTATLGDPAGHLSRLGGVPEVDVAVVDRDGSAGGARWFAAWNPPLVNESAGEERGGRGEGETVGSGGEPRRGETGGSDLDGTGLPRLIETDRDASRGWNARGASSLTRRGSAVGGFSTAPRSLPVASARDLSDRARSRLAALDRRLQASEERRNATRLGVGERRAAGRGAGRSLAAGGEVGSEGGLSGEGSREAEAPGEDASGAAPPARPARSQCAVNPISTSSFVPPASSCRSARPSPALLLAARWAIDSTKLSCGPSISSSSTSSGRGGRRSRAQTLPGEKTSTLARALETLSLEASEAGEGDAGDAGGAARAPEDPPVDANAVRVAWRDARRRARARAQGDGEGYGGSRGGSRGDGDGPAVGLEATSSPSINGSSGSHVALFAHPPSANYPPAPMYAPAAPVVPGPSRRRPTIGESAWLLADAVLCGLQAVVFCGSRRICEVVLAMAQEELERAERGRRGGAEAPSPGGRAVGCLRGDDRDGGSGAVHGGDGGDDLGAVRGGDGSDDLGAVRGGDGSDDLGAVRGNNDATPVDVDGAPVSPRLPSPDALPPSPDAPVPLSTRLACYRAGYSAPERRALERAISSAEVRGVVATNALELGVDVGSLDVVIHLGWPGSVSSLKQQAGRAGRRMPSGVGGEADSADATGDDPIPLTACSIFVPFENAMDQFRAKHAGEIWATPPEPVPLDPTAPGALDYHLLCAAQEMELAREEFRADEGYMEVAREPPAPRHSDGAEGGLAAPARGQSVDGAREALLLSAAPRSPDPPRRASPTSSSRASDASSWPRGALFPPESIPRLRLLVRAQLLVPLGASRPSSLPRQRPRDAAHGSPLRSGPDPSPVAFRYSGPARPQAAMGLRAIEDERVRVVLQDGREDGADPTVLEELEADRAYFSVYEGAVYLRQGRSYVIVRAEPLRGYVVAQRRRVGYYTLLSDSRVVRLLGGRRTTPPACRPFGACCTPAKVTQLFLGYYKVAKATHTTIDTVELSLPPREHITRALAVPVDVRRAYRCGVGRGVGTDVDLEGEADAEEETVDGGDAHAVGDADAGGDVVGRGDAHARGGADAGRNERPASPRLVLGSPFPREPARSPPSPPPADGETVAESASASASPAFGALPSPELASSSQWTAESLERAGEWDLSASAPPPPAPSRADPPPFNLRAALHAANHALLRAASLLLALDAKDLDTECDSPYDLRNRAARLLAFDRRGDGAGAADAISRRLGEVLRRALALLVDCACEDDEGCPQCVQWDDCGEHNHVLSKSGAIAVLRSVLVASLAREAERRRNEEWERSQRQKELAEAIGEGER